MKSVEVDNFLLVTSYYFIDKHFGLNYYLYSSTSLVRASVVRGPSVVRGLEWQNFSSL